MIFPKTWIKRAFLAAYIFEHDAYQTQHHGASIRSGFWPRLMRDLQDAARLGGQQGGYLHLETPAAPSRPAVYQPPPNPIDAAAAALVDYGQEVRRAQQEEANLLKDYVTGGGNNAGPFGLQFTKVPQYAAKIPSRTCSLTSLPNVSQETTAQGGKRAHGKVSAAGSQEWRKCRRSKLRSVQCMLKQAAAEGIRLLQGIKQQQRDGGAFSKSRSFFSGATAAAAAAESRMPSEMEPKLPEAQTKVQRGRSVEGGVLMEGQGGPDTSSLLLQRLVEGSQLLAKELDEHIRSFGHTELPSFSLLLETRKKRRALRPWKRAVATVRKRQVQQSKRGTDHRRTRTLSRRASSYAPAAKTSHCYAVASLGESSDGKRLAQLQLKEELRRRVYEQMEARAAERQQQLPKSGPDATEVPGDGSQKEGILRIFKEGFDSDPPSSHGSYETASEFESSDSAPTEAYVSPSSLSSNSLSSSRRSSCSRTSSEGSQKSIADTESGPGLCERQAPCKIAASVQGRGCRSKNTTSAASSESCSSEIKIEATAGRSGNLVAARSTAVFQGSGKVRKRRNRGLEFQWVAAKPEQRQRVSDSIPGRQQHVALSLTSEGGVGEHQIASSKESFQDCAPLRLMPQQASPDYPFALVDLEAQSSQSIVSEKSTLHSLPDSDACEPPAAGCSSKRSPPLSYAGLRNLKQRTRRLINRNDSRATSSCESVAAFLESIMSEKATSGSESGKRHFPAESRLPGSTPTTDTPQPSDAHPYTEAAVEYPLLMAVGKPGGGVSARMQRLYACCLQRAERSFLSGKRKCPKVLFRHPEATAEKAVETCAAVLAASVGQTVRENMPSEAVSSSGLRGADQPNERGSRGTGSTSVGGRKLSGKLASGESGVAAIGMKFIESREHGMMLDIDYDQANRNWGASSNALSGPPVSGSSEDSTNGRLNGKEFQP